MNYLQLLQRADKHFLTGNKMTSYSSTLGGGSINYWDGRYEFEELTWTGPMEGKEAVIRVFDKDRKKDLQQVFDHQWRPDRIVTRYKSHLESTIQETKCIHDDVFVNTLEFAYEAYESRPLELIVELSGVSRGPAEIEFVENYIHVHEGAGQHKGLHKILGFDTKVKGRIEGQSYFLEFPLILESLAPDKDHLEPQMVTCVVAIDKDLDTAIQKYKVAVDNPKRMFLQVNENWQTYFEKNVPRFSCDESLITKLYYYNYYVSKSNTYDFAEGYFSNSFSTLSKTRLLPMWFWDIGFQAVYEKWLKDLPLPRGSIMNLLVSQRADGFIAMTLCKDGPVFGEAIQPFMIPLAIWEMYLQNGDKSLLEETLPHLVDFDRWMKANRCMNNGELIHLVIPGESGWDNSKRFLLHSSLLMEASPMLRDHRPIEPPDFNTYIYIARQIIARMAQELSKEVLAKEYQVKAQLLKEAIAKMWDEEVGLYCDQFADGQDKIRVKSPGGMIPMLGGIPDEGQTARIVEHLTNPGEFWTEYPLPTLSKDDPDYNARDEYQSYWNGRVWPNINWLVIEGLKRRGQLKIAKELVRRSIRMPVASGMPFTRENYHADTGEPFFRCNQENYGWGGMANDLLIKQVMGIQPNIPKDEIYINPLFPDDWNWMRIEGLQLGAHGVDAQINRTDGGIEYRLTHRGDRELTVITSEQREIVKDKTVLLTVAEEDLPHWLDM